MPRLAHPHWFDHPNNIWWRVKIMKLLIVHFSLASCYFSSFVRYSHQLFVLKTSWMYFLMGVSASFFALSLEFSRYVRVILSNCCVQRANGRHKDWRKTIKQACDKIRLPLSSSKP
jgi:hypothetical protein